MKHVLWAIKLTIELHYYLNINVKKIPGENERCIDSTFKTYLNIYNNKC